MKLCCFEGPEGLGLGLVAGNEVTDLRKAAPHLSLNPVDILAAGAAGREAVEKAARAAPRLALSQVKLRCPVQARPSKILGIGLNYHDHAKETGREAPTTQMWFNKQVSSLHDPFAPVQLPAVSKALDYEVELVVVI